jgi:exodeoxyribonuclease-5
MMAKKIKNILKDGYEITLGFELTDAQKDVLDRIDRFIKDDSKGAEKLLTVSGVAGSGKTSIMECVRLRYMWDKNPATGRFYKIFFASTTHRAAGVLKSKVKTKVYTLHSLFGINVETDMEGDRYDCKKKKNRVGEDKLDRDSIVIIDEASMINRENFGIIRDACKVMNVKCIFCGDKCQLAPVGDDEGDCSVVFKGEGGDILELTDIMRTDNNSILNESIYVRGYGDFSFNSDWDSSENKGVLFLDRNDIGTLSDLLDYNVAKLKKDPNAFRFITYTNDNVEKLNTLVRRKMGYNDIIPRRNEVLMSYTNMGYQGGGEYYIVNSESYIVEAIEGVDETDVSEYLEGCNVGERYITSHRLKLRDALGDIKRVNYIDIRENLMNREVAQILAEEKVRLWKLWRACDDKKERGLITGKINQIENFLFVNDNIYNEQGWLLQGKAVSYSYAITCHKIQGGENDCVIINSLDFNRCQDRKVLEQLRYVGVTRAKKALIILK